MIRKSQQYDRSHFTNHYVKARKKDQAFCAIPALRTATFIRDACRNCAITCSGLPSYSLKGEDDE